MIATSWDDNDILWFENDGSQSFTQHIVEEAANGAWTAVGYDVDFDSDVDIVACHYKESVVAWHENDGSQSFYERALATSSSAGR